MRRARVSAALIAAFAVAGAAGAGAAQARTLYVQAGGSGGDGLRNTPFASLAAVEAASAPGDRIVVLLAPTGTPPLDGGIQLKYGQELVGGSPDGSGPSTRRLPELTNTTGHLRGDAVRLADATTVRNVAISGSARGGIYGNDVSGVTIAGNDLTAFNTHCVPGFLIPPFNVPTIAPGVGVPISDGLPNAWAAIMVDAHSGVRSAAIHGNRVHDSDCGDGIDVRAFGSAQVSAAITGNLVLNLREGPGMSSILAIGLQTSDHATMEAIVDGNRQAGLGNDEDSGVGPGGADSEGVFVNPTEHSRLRAHVTHNHYRHTPGRGGFSANGLEFVSMGDGAHGDLIVEDSSFAGPPGDVIEQLALGTNGRLRMTLRRVKATASTGFAESGIGDTVVIPGNDADCVIAASGGAGNTVQLTARHTILSDCANNGLTLGSSVSNGEGPSRLLTLDMSDSLITANHGGNLRIGNLSGLDHLRVKVQRTSLTNSGGVGSSPADLIAENLGTTKHATIDLGGGSLGSKGANCLHGGKLTAALVAYDVTARGNWWGQAGGPALGQTVAAGGTLDSASPLGTAPAGC